MSSHIAVSLLLILALGCVTEIKASEFLEQLGGTFLKVLEICKTELGITSSILPDFHRIWTEDDASVSRETGCVLHCMSNKLNFFTIKMKHGETKEFALKNGADEAMASELDKLLHECEDKYGGEPDECIRTSELAKCVRRSMKQVNWRPPLEVFMEEVIVEV